MVGLYFCFIGFFQLTHGNPELGKRFTVGGVAMIVLGLGSFLFHATMLYSMQLADELPMSYGALLMIYMCLESEALPKYPALPYILGAYAVVTTVVQIIITKTIPIFHEIQVTDPLQ